MTDLIHYTVEDHIGWITINRPDKRNAINADMRRALFAAYSDIKHNPDVRVAVLIGEGKTFCSGEDLKESHGGPDDHLTTEDLDALQQTIYTPIIAAVNGPAIGQGTRFVFNSDIVIMATGASLIWPQVKIGFSSVSGPAVFAQMMPRPMAMGYLLRGIPVDAATCLRHGLANEVVEASDLRDAAKRWAGQLLECAPLALKFIKEATRRSEALPPQSRKQIAYDIYERSMHTADAQEGIRAFAEKRPPVWKGV